MGWEGEGKRVQCLLILTIGKQNKLFKPVLMKLSKSQSKHRLRQFSSGCYRKPHVRLLSWNCIYLFMSLKIRQNVLLIFCFHQIFVNLRVFSTSYSLNKQSTILWPLKWNSFKWQIINCFHLFIRLPAVLFSRCPKQNSVQSGIHQRLHDALRRSPVSSILCLCPPVVRNLQHSRYVRLFEMYEHCN